MEGLDLLDASDTESESDKDEQADARLARRARREKMREEAAAAATESVLDTTADSVAECAKKLEKVSTSDTAKVADTTVAGTSRPNLIITVSNEDAGKKNSRSDKKDYSAGADLHGAPTIHYKVRADPSGAQTENRSGKANPCGANPNIQTGKANHYGASGTGRTANLDGANSPAPVHADQYGADIGAAKKLDGGVYSAVAARRKNARISPNLRGGFDTDKSDIGSFSIPGDKRVDNCQTRFLIDKGQNMSFSFDPDSMLCFTCSGRGSHPVTRDGLSGGGRWLGSVSFCLTTTFPQSCPAAMGSVSKL